jgi:hypothetical protein
MWERYRWITLIASAAKNYDVRMTFSIQAPGAVVLIRPHRFSPNPMSAADNAFQHEGGADRRELANGAFRETIDAAETLREHGVTVHLFEDEEASYPDSVFPNNWISTHSGGHIALFPMYVANRRGERRADIVEFLKANYRVQDVIDYSGLEYDDVFLEGTGAMVLDHLTRVAYVARSRRADPVALERFCTNFGYEPMVFDAFDEHSVPIYHTNVMMCVATEFAMIDLGSIRDQTRREQVSARLTAPGRDLIDLSPGQVREFAGNALELQGSAGRLLALSSRASSSLSDIQRRTIERSCTIVPLDIPTIELAGGSVRCMLAGIHLDARPAGARASSPLPLSAVGAKRR